MQFKQISAVKVGERYGIVLFALSEEGHIYSYHTLVGNLSKGRWSKVDAPKEEAAQPKVR